MLTVGNEPHAGAAIAGIVHGRVVAEVIGVLLNGEMATLGASDKAPTSQIMERRLAVRSKMLISQM